MRIPLIISSLVAGSLLLSAWSNGGARGGSKAVSNPSPPVISNIVSSPGTTTAAITWTTSTSSNSLVNYGLTSGYGSTQSDATMVTSHTINLTSLSSSTTYHFNVCSTDAYSQQTCSTDQTFATGGVTAGCPFGTGASDGCSSANTTVTGAKQQSSFFTTYAPQNGQTYQSCSFTGTISASGATLTTSSETKPAAPFVFTNCIRPGNSIQGAGISVGCFVVSGTATPYTLGGNCPATAGPEAMTALVRPPWDVAGVDYPVGASETGMILASTIPSCGSGNTQGLCDYGDQGGNFWLIGCAGGQTCQNISNIDFRYDGTKGYYLNITNGWAAAQCKFQNNIFGGSAGLYLQNTAGAPFYISPSSSCTSYVFDHNSFYGLADTYAVIGGVGTGHTPSPWIQLGGSGAGLIDIPITMTYNWFNNWNGNIGFLYSATFKYNYLEGLNYNSASHGEYTKFGLCASAGNADCQLGSTGGVFSISSIPILSYNTGLTRSTDCGGQTAFFWLHNGQGPPNAFNHTNGYSVTNNTTINNMCNAYSITNVAGNSLTIAVPAAYPATGSVFSCGTPPSTCGAGSVTLAQPWGTAQGSIVGQTSGSDGISGVYTYTGGTIVNGTILSWATSCPGVVLNPYQTSGTINVQNNYTDPTGYLGNQHWATTTQMGACFGGMSGPTINNTGNINMNLNTVAN